MGWSTEPRPHMVVVRRVSPQGDDPRPTVVPASTVYWVDYPTRPVHAAAYDMWAAPNQEE